MEEQSLTKKIIGLVMLVGSGILLLSLGIYMNRAAQREIHGLPEIFPAEEVVLYSEFPLSTPPAALKPLVDKAGVFWDRDIAPWVGNQGAFALLKGTDGLLSPLFVFETKDITAARNFFVHYQNPTGAFSTEVVGGYSLFETDRIHVAFDETRALVAPSRALLNEVIEMQNRSRKHLGQLDSFIEVRRRMSAPYRLYVELDTLGSQITNFVSQYVPRMPFETSPFSHLGVEFAAEGNRFKGATFALMKHTIASSRDEKYNAVLLPYIPSDIDLVVGGQDLTLQLEKSATISRLNAGTPTLDQVVSAFMKSYLPGLDFKRDVGPVLADEFAIGGKGDELLFVVRVDVEHYGPLLSAIEAAYAKAAEKFAPGVQDVVLADGTKAQEYVPDPTNVRMVTEEFEGITIRGIVSGKTNHLYSAITQGKWFISSDTTILKNALLLTKKSGNSLSESQLYKESLAPILLNPELVAVTRLKLGKFLHGTLSFGKRTFTDHMETHFTFVLE